MKAGAVPTLNTAAAVDPNDPAAKAAKARNDAKTAGKQLEAFFLRQMLAEARPQGGGAIDGGFAGDTFKQMLDDAIADKMSAAGGVGMSQLFAKQLGGAVDGEPQASLGVTKGFVSIDETAALPATPIANAPVSSSSSAAAMVDAVDAANAAQASSAIGAPHFILPVAGRPSSGYGLRADPIKGETINHPGFDLAATTGTPVGAAAGGTVVHAGPAGTYGNLVTVRHDNGFETRYAHLSAVDVKVGDRVEPGQDLGKVGTTGYSTGPHLHFEVRHDGQAIDPAPLLPLHRSAVRTSR